MLPTGPIPPPPAAFFDNDTPDEYIAVAGADDAEDAEDATGAGVDLDAGTNAASRDGKYSRQVLLPCVRCEVVANVAPLSQNPSAHSRVVGDPWAA